jgi:Kef-type K+ transport system membrane component KefB
MNTTLTHLLASPVTVIGLATILALYAGKLAQKGRLPSIIGFMLLGAILGPSVVHLLTEELQEQLGFINDIALGFVALSIGLELSFTALKRQGKAIIFIIFSESIFTAIVVTAALGLLTGNWPFAILFGAIAPASAPAGTVAIIQEYRAKGPLTQALYSVVGFDDGLGIIIFGFASANCRSAPQRKRLFRSYPAHAAPRGCGKPRRRPGPSARSPGYSPPASRHGGTSSR